MTLSKTIANPYRILAGDRWSYQTRNPKPLTLNPKLEEIPIKAYKLIPREPNTP